MKFTQLAGGDTSLKRARCHRLVGLGGFGLLAGHIEIGGGPHAEKATIDRETAPFAGFDFILCFPYKCRPADMT